MDAGSPRSFLLLDRRSLSVRVRGGGASDRRGRGSYRRGLLLCSGVRSGIAGVTVELYGPDDRLIGTNTTNTTGHYIFPGLSNGEYKVRIPMPQSALEGMTNTTPNVPPDDSIDSDGIPMP